VFADAFADEDDDDIGFPLAVMTWASYFSTIASNVVVMFATKRLSGESYGDS